MFGKKRDRFLEFIDAKGNIATNPNADPGSRMVARSDLVGYAKEVGNSKNPYIRSGKVIDKLTEYAMNARDVAVQEGDLTEHEAHRWWGEVCDPLKDIQATDF